MENEIQNETLAEIQTEAQTKIQPEPQPKVKTTKCLNCGTEFERNFCPECGQSADTGRFTMRFIFENLIAAFTSKDGGIWFTLKNLFTRPGAMVVELLNGKRRSYFSPFPMLFFALTVYILLFTFTGSRGDIQEIEQKIKDSEITIESDLDEKTQMALARFNDIKKLVGKGVKIYYTRYTTVTMLTIPLFLFATRAWYGKSNRKRYYRAEYLVAIAYAMVMVVLYRCLTSLVYPLSQNVAGTMTDFIPLVTIAAFTACFRRMMGFSIAKTAWRSLLALVLYYMVLGILLLIICIGIYFYLIRNNNSVGM
jgi:hypothetical protein